MTRKRKTEIVDLEIIEVANRRGNKTLKTKPLPPPPKAQSKTSTASQSPSKQPQFTEPPEGNIIFNDDDGFHNFTDSLPQAGRQTKVIFLAPF
jgi:hypothetical protein